MNALEIDLRMSSNLHISLALQHIYIQYWTSTGNEDYIQSESAYVITIHVKTQKQIRFMHSVMHPVDARLQARCHFEHHQTPPLIITVVPSKHNPSLPFSTPRKYSFPYLRDSIFDQIACVGIAEIRASRQLLIDEEEG